MNKTTHKALLIVVLLAPFGAALGLGASAETTDFSAKELRCEYLSNPMGIDTRNPRLSWVLNPAGKVRRQSAYHLLVASTPQILRRDQGDLWDTSRIVSEQTTWIAYGGKNLSSGQRVYWKVRVWSDSGKESR